MAIREKLQYLSRIALIVLAVLATISCGSLPLSSTPTSMPTQTFIPSPTFTPIPTSTPTATQTPTATPVHFETVNLAGGSILVTDQVAGYQFILAKGWREIDSLKSMYEATYSVGLKTLNLSISMGEREGTLDFELSKHTEKRALGMDRLLTSVITTNDYGTLLGYLRYMDFLRGGIHGSVYQDVYKILFIVDDQVVSISFYGEQGIKPPNDTLLPIIRSVQNSIQIK